MLEIGPFSAAQKTNRFWNWGQLGSQLARGLCLASPAARDTACTSYEQHTEKGSCVHLSLGALPCTRVGLVRTVVFAGLRCGLVCMGVLVGTGEKSGKGFYQYDNKRRQKPDPEIKAFVEKARKFANIMPNGKVGTPQETHCHVWVSRAHAAGDVVCERGEPGDIGRC